jgi:hypothetical protein
MRVTQDDLLAAIRDALARPVAGDGFTGPELARKFGVRDNAARDVLRVMMAEGRLEIVTLKRQGLDGRQMTVRGYRLKRKAKRAA